MWDVRYTGRPAVDTKPLVVVWRNAVTSDGYRIEDPKVLSGFDVAVQARFQLKVRIGIRNGVHNVESE